MSALTDRQLLHTLMQNLNMAEAALVKVRELTPMEHSINDDPSFRYDVAAGLKAILGAQASLVAYAYETDHLIWNESPSETL